MYKYKYEYRSCFNYDSGMYQVRRCKNLGLHSPMTHRERSPRIPPEFRDFPRELSPAFFESFTTFQGREDIDHSVRHGSKIGIIKVEWHLIHIQTPEWAPRERAQLLELGVF